MRKMYVGNLAPETRRGFGFVEMEGHEARAAIAALNGAELNGRQIKVNEERPRDKRAGGRR